MKKIILYVLLFSNLAFSQELVNTIDFDLNKVKSFYRLEDTKNKEFALILKNKEDIEFVKTDANFKTIERFVYTEQDKLDDFFGNSFNENVYYTYWKKNNKSLDVLAINFTTKSCVKSEINYPISKNEMILCTYTKDNNFYIISVTKQTSLLHYYKLNGLNVERKSIDCSKMIFVNATNQKINFWNYLTEGNETVYKHDFPTFFVDKLNFNAVHATEKRKIYISDDTIILASDMNNGFSQFVSISLTDFTANSHIISKNDENLNELLLFEETNSFVIDNKIFIAMFSKEKILVIIKTFENKTLNSFFITPTEGHAYINSELIEESGGIKNREILKSTEKFLKRSFAKNPSIIGYISNGNYNLTIAGVSYPRQQSYQMLGMFGFVGGLTAAIINDGSGSSITSYSNKVVVYIRSCITASDFKPTGIKYISNYDTLRSYVEINSSNENFLTLFESNNHFYVFAQKNKKEKVNIYKF